MSVTWNDYATLLQETLWPLQLWVPNHSTNYAEVCNAEKSV